MGKTKYQKAVEFLDGIKKTQGATISFESFKNQAIMKLGADETRTLKPYLKMMAEFNLIIEAGEQIVIV